MHQRGGQLSGRWSALPTQAKELRKLLEIPGTPRGCGSGRSVGVFPQTGFTCQLGHITGQGNWTS